MSGWRFLTKAVQYTGLWYNTIQPWGSKKTDDPEGRKLAVTEFGHPPPFSARPFSPVTFPLRKSNSTLSIHLLSSRLHVKTPPTHYTPDRHHRNGRESNIERCPEDDHNQPPFQSTPFPYTPITMSTMTTLERSHSCTSSNSLSMSSPRLSVRREVTPPGSELSLTHLHDRINQLDSRVLELRSTVLTKEGYVDRRNREDDHIRREFQHHQAISQRIDLNVVALRSDVDQIRTSIFQLKSSIGQSGTETVYLRGDVDRLQKTTDQLQVDIAAIKSEACATRIDISKLQTASNQLRTDLITLDHKISRQYNALTSRMDSLESQMTSRMSSIESQMKYADRVRFNSLAHTVHAPINPVPVIMDDGTLEWPQYFPRTVWRFWCLKKRSRGKLLVSMHLTYLSIPSLPCSHLLPSSSSLD